LKSILSFQPAPIVQPSLNRRRFEGSASRRKAAGSDGSYELGVMNVAAAMARL